MASSIAVLPTGSASLRLSRASSILRPITRRHESTARRNRSRLNIKPDASFLPSKTEPHDHIIFNPPPSMPNVYHTPNIFLPKNDARRQLTEPQNASNLLGTNGSTADLAPPVRPPYEKKYHLTEQDIEKMRSLRKENAGKWCFSRLAREFDCSKMFARTVCSGLSPKQASLQRQVEEIVKSNWSKERTIAREDRAIRKERWYRDE